MGSVTAATVTVRPQIDGQILSLSFKEGELVQAGKLLATIDPRPYQSQLVQIEGNLSQDQAQLANARIDLARYRNLATANAIPASQADSQATVVAQMEAKVKAGQAAVDGVKLQLAYCQITAPISGVAGLRLVDAGNVVHASDSTGIVVINQLQPISVVFTLPEDVLPGVLAHLRSGQTPPVEAWNRSNTSRIASGRLIAVDNQIDKETGTAKLKAVFDNQDGALFPNQFVNVRVLLYARKPAR